MNLDEIKELIHLVQESGVAELEVQRGENRVRIKRSNNAAPQEIVIAPAGAPPVLTAAHTSAAMASPGAIPAVAVNSAAQGAADAGEPEPEFSYVKSPIVGTYYESASPGSPPFVKVGDHVSEGQVLCIIESMKLMNEIESEFNGTIARKLVENGKPVEYGQTLFAVKPD